MLEMLKGRSAPSRKFIEEPRTSHEGIDVLKEYLSIPAEKRKSFAHYLRTKRE